MSGLDRLALGFLLVDAVLLALIEMLYLPSYLGTVQFPVTALVAGFTTPQLVALAGRLSPRKSVAAAPLVVWFLTVVVFGVGGPGGDIVLPGMGWRTLFFIGAGTVPAAMMLGIVMGRVAVRR